MPLSNASNGLKIKEIIIKGNFLKKVPLNPQKLLVILQQCCKIDKSFERVWEIFYKRSPKMAIFNTNRHCLIRLKCALRRPHRATDENADARFPISQILSANPAKVLPSSKIHKTAFINNRLSFAMLLHCPFCPGKIGAKMLHCSSVNHVCVRICRSYIHIVVLLAICQSQVDTI